MTADTTSSNEENTIELNEVANILKIHPRTVLRALSNEVNTYWAIGYTENIDIDDISDVFGFDPVYIRRAKKKRDEFFKPTEAADFIDVPSRTFRYRKYPALIRRGGIVRYSRKDVTTYHINTYL